MMPDTALIGTMMGVAFVLLFGGIVYYVWGWLPAASNEE